MALLKFNNEILKYGDDLLKYESGVEPEPTEGYWKHYQTGVITPILLTDSNISGGNTWNSTPYALEVSELKLPHGITTIGGGISMGNMPELLTLDLPSTISVYGANFLGETRKMTTLIFRNPTPPLPTDVSLGAWLGDLDNFIGVFVPPQSVALYQSTEPWVPYASFILPMP